MEDRKGSVVSSMDAEDKLEAVRALVAGWGKPLDAPPQRWMTWVRGRYPASRTHDTQVQVMVSLKDATIPILKEDNRGIEWTFGEDAILYQMIGGRYVVVDAVRRGTPWEEWKKER